MKIDGIQLTQEHVGRDVLVTNRIAHYLPLGLATNIKEIDLDDDAISVEDAEGDTVWVDADQLENLSFDIKGKTPKLDVACVEEQRKIVAKKIKDRFNTLTTLEKDLKSAEKLYEDAVFEGESLDLVIEESVSPNKIKVTYQPEIIVLIEQ